MANNHTSLPTTTSTTSNSSTTESAPINPKARQYSHLHSRLATLNAHLADLENLVRMTSVQAGDMRFLGGYVGGLFMGASKVLGEEGVVGNGGGSGRKDGDTEVDGESRSRG
jgi:hypothetical protein